ncbi:MAG TPA: hypothetical protein VJL28_08185 [Gemmatimonadaceae bacterium]|nr:hypothetical protein [Gemmatimonadaceae bacterium]
MRTHSLVIGGAVAIALATSPAYAQSGNGSDVTGPTGGSLAGGTFAPLPVPTGAGGGRVSIPPSPMAGPTVTSTAQSFSSGATQTSPATGQPIPVGAVTAIGALITSGSPATVAQVGAALQSSGAPGAEVAALTQALAALANVSPSAAPGAIITAALAFNALVANAPASFLQNPPAQFLAIHAALVPMANSIGR